MQFVSFVYRTKRTRSLLSFFFSHSHLISLCIIPKCWQSFVFISHDFFGWPLFDCWPSRGWSSIGSTLFDVAAAVAALLGLKAYTFSGTSIEINVANVTQS